MYGYYLRLNVVFYRTLISRSKTINEPTRKKLEPAEKYLILTPRRVLNVVKHFPRRQIRQLIAPTNFYRSTSCAGGIPRAGCATATHVYVCMGETRGDQPKVDRRFCAGGRTRTPVFFSQFHLFSSFAFSLFPSTVANECRSTDASSAGLTRPDGCSWNPGTPLGREHATSKIAV